jgi:hypothetical protein
LNFVESNGFVSDALDEAAFGCADPLFVTLRPYDLSRTTAVRGV